MSHIAYIGWRSFAKIFLYSCTILSVVKIKFSLIYENVSSSIVPIFLEFQYKNTKKMINLLTYMLNCLKKYRNFRHENTAFVIWKYPSI